MPQLCGADETIAITIEDFEGLDEFLLRVRILHFTSHQRQELGEIDRAVAVGVDFIDHVLELSLRRILTQGAHDGAQLFRGDRAVAVLIKGVCMLICNGLPRS